MRELALIASNYALFVVLLCWLAAMQASLWMHIFGFTPAPFLWLTVLNYWVLNRNLPESVIMTYLATFTLVSMSGIPMSMAFAVMLSTFGIIYFMRDRVLWSGSNSFMLSCGISAFSLPIFTFIWSYILEDRPISDFHIFDMIVRTLLTTVCSLPLYYLFTWIDRLTHKHLTKDNESSVI